jgi:ribosomal-protein-alanine N-acetyltransferase
MMYESGPAGPVRIQRAGPVHARVIAGLSECGSTGPWTDYAVARLLGLPGYWGLLAVEPHGVPIGFLVARVAADEAEILNLVVAGGARRAGVGRSLVNAALEKAREFGASVVFLEVAADNSAGRSLYGSAGFRRVGIRPDYYRRKSGDYVDALIMKRATVKSTID